jgi:TIGR03118 family protein
VNGAPASFIYANLNGTISAWNSRVGTTAVVETTPTGGVYTGLVLESTASGDFLYAANPKQGRIDVFDRSFNKVTLPTGAFVDSQAAGLVPFSVDDINGDLYVMYAPAGPPTARNMVLEGHGAVGCSIRAGTSSNS